MLTLYRDEGGAVRSGPDRDLPEHVIWMDLVDPTDEERAFVEGRAGIRVPSREALSEIEATSRLIVERGVLYLSMPLLARASGTEFVLSPVGFVLGPRVLVTVRFAALPAFDTVAEQVRGDETLASGVGVFTALLETVVDRGADVLERLGAELDRVSRSVFRGDSTDPRHEVRKSASLRALLSTVGNVGDRASQARDILLGAGRIAAFVDDLGTKWISEEFHARLRAVSKDVASLNDYESHLSNKVQFLLDAILGFISIEQNDLFKILTIASVVGVPPTLLAGVWGMNFKAMPELDWTWGYPMALVVILLSAVVPLVWFKRRGWF